MRKSTFFQSSLVIIVLALLLFLTVPVFAQSETIPGASPPNPMTAKVLIVVSLVAEIAGLSTFVFAGVALLKKIGISGNWLTLSSFAWGLIFGGAYRFFMYPPTIALDWFLLVAFGLSGGFLASGVYDGIRSAAGQPKQPSYQPPFKPER